MAGPAYPSLPEIVTKSAEVRPPPGSPPCPARDSPHARGACLVAGEPELLRDVRPEVRTPAVVVERLVRVRPEVVIPALRVMLGDIQEIERAVPRVRVGV